MRILIVEDEPWLRRCLTRSLSGRGHDVLEASSRAMAQTVLTGTAIDLILLDINLPDGTGWDVLRWLAERDRTTPSVIISAVPASARRVKEFRPLAVLTKPFPIDAIHRLVEQVEAARNGKERSTTASFLE